MLIAQVTDLHLHADPGHPNLARFKRVLDHLLTLQPPPDLLVLSGDLADDGALESYRHLQGALARWPRPVRLALGNHDSRAHFQAVFGGVHAADGFVQSRSAFGALQVVVLDTLEEGRHGGAFCEARAGWLRQAVQDSEGAPLLVFLHHPPVDVGIPWIDPGPCQDWIARLDGALQGAQVAGICSGHVHLGGVFRWRGRQVVTCPSSSSDLSLGFASMMGGQPDGRPLVEQGEPAFALNRWEDGALATLFGRCPQRVLARWDAGTQPMVTSMLAEKKPA
ncbi:3',5'-cyclic adenosine monophosphate phosphodiesterase CpdA [Massilia varians]|uniref:3',5'-cyclic adenosine monophosphate phosphodiesterase CpdA n=1 Tax=Massilia varians TaxID=457921 RepID=A0ABN6T5Z5_9BURK|nr:metallophosphoesterase [Massilia varians]BDT57669.1 3',5'-cyclic adenosine monophosphate phosphodiesterase CpdA [Massilia varians]